MDGVSTVATVSSGISPADNLDFGTKSCEKHFCCLSSLPVVFSYSIACRLTQQPNRGESFDEKIQYLFKKKSLKRRVMDAEAILKWAREEQPQQDHRSRAVTCSPGLGHWKTCFRLSRTRHWLSGGRARCWVCRSRCFIHLRGFAILSNPCQLAGLSLK